MATGTAMQDVQTALAGVEQIALAGASPFIHSDAGKTKVQTIAAEVNLGIAALPLFESLFRIIAHLFHHAHAATVASQPAPVAAATPDATK